MSCLWQFNLPLATKAWILDLDPHGCALVGPRPDDTYIATRGFDLWELVCAECQHVATFSLRQQLIFYPGAEIKWRQLSTLGPGGGSDIGAFVVATISLE